MRQGFWWTIKSKWVVLGRRDFNSWINLWPDIEHERARWGVVYNRNEVMMQRATLIAAASGTVLMTSVTWQRAAYRIVRNDAAAIECVKCVSVKQRRNSSDLDQNE